MKVMDMTHPTNFELKKRVLSLKLTSMVGVLSPGRGSGDIPSNFPSSSGRQPTFWAEGLDVNQIFLQLSPGALVKSL